MIVSNFVGCCIASLSLAAALISLNYGLKIKNINLAAHLILLSSFFQILFVLLQKTKLKKNFEFKKLIVSLFTALLEFGIIFTLHSLLKNNSLPITVCSLSLIVGLVVIKNARNYTVNSFLLLFVVILTFSFLNILEGYEQTWFYTDPLDIENLYFPVYIPNLLLFFICLGFRIMLYIYSKSVVLLQNCEFFTAVYLFVSGLFLVFIEKQEFFDSLSVMKDGLLYYVIAFLSFTVFYVSIFKFEHDKKFGLLFISFLLLIHVAYLVLDAIIVKTILEKNVLEVYFLLLSVHIFSFFAVLDIRRVFESRREEQRENRQNNAVDATAEAPDL